ncbi:hypothetical protein SASPL_107790 [Salvia splendens]|uniref:Rubisco LSMT substrate-binding domain-containing protein n=1 Tax=Salvia splendens TaxID=180675 RepID=A0A8X9A4S0_SALSN|nr:hypothetical protein SASPL_107790 [Salvia splendens]
MLRSRAFSLRNQNFVIIPFADLINHSMFRLRLKIMCTREAFLMGLSVSNKEPFISQGWFSSNIISTKVVQIWLWTKVLLNWKTPVVMGFTLTLEISESDEFFEDKLDIAEMNGFGESAYFDIKDGQQTLQTEMLQYLLLLALGGTDAFLLESIFRNQLWGFLELPVSRANEELICQDEKLIEEGNLSSRLAVAGGVRRGEKKVLQQIDDIFRERESELDFLEYYQERRLKDLGLVGEQGDIIFWEPK